MSRLRRAHSPLALRLAELRTGARFMGLRPVDGVGRPGARPLLVVHNSADKVVRAHDDAEMYAAAASDRVARILAAALGR